MNYNVKVNKIGMSAMELYEECGCLIIFDDIAPEELAEIAVLHEEGEIKTEKRCAIWDEHQRTLHFELLTRTKAEF